MTLISLRDHQKTIVQSNLALLDLTIRRKNTNLTSLSVLEGSEHDTNRIWYLGLNGLKVFKRERLISTGQHCNRILKDWSTQQTEDVKWIYWVNCSVKSKLFPIWADCSDELFCNKVIYWFKWLHLDQEILGVGRGNVGFLLSVPIIKLCGQSLASATSWK